MMSKTMLSLCAVFAIVLAATPAVTPAAEKGSTKNGAIVVKDSVYAKATIVGIKKKERELTLRDETGAEFVVTAGKEVRNFAQIKKGDVVEVEYHRAAATMLEKASEANVAGQASTIERAPAGSKPGMRAMHTSSIVASVVEIDAKNRLLTLQGPQGNIVTVKVPVEMKAFDSLKKGDRISAVYSEAVAVSVKTPAKKK